MWFYDYTGEYDVVNINYDTGGDHLIIDAIEVSETEEDEIE